MRNDLQADDEEIFIPELHGYVTACVEVISTARMLFEIAHDLAQLDTRIYLYPCQTSRCAKAGATHLRKKSPRELRRHENTKATLKLKKALAFYLT